MNFSKIIGGVVIAGVIAGISTPIIYDKQINKIITQQQKTLSNNGITLTKKEINDTFTTIHRKYILTIDDIKPLIKEIYPQIHTNLDDIQQIFNETKFLVTIDMLKYPIYHKNAIKISLLNLNNKISNTLNNDEVGKQLVKYIKNKAFELILDIDNIKITKASLKNINLTLTEKQYDGSIETINTSINGLNILFKKQTLTTLNSLIFNVDTKKEKINFALNNFKDILSKKNDFNYKEISSIQTIQIDIKKPTDNGIIKLNNITSSSNVSTIVNKLNISNKFNIKKIDVTSKNLNFNIDNFILNFKFNKLDLSSIKTLANTIKNLQNIQNKQQLRTSIQTIINKGFEFKLSPLSLDSASINKIKIDKIKIDFNTILKSNLYSIQNSPEELLNYLTANLTIHTTQNNIDLISKLNPMSAIYISSFIKIDNNKNAIINISYKNGKLLSNGKVVF